MGDKDSAATFEDGLEAPDSMDAMDLWESGSLPPIPGEAEVLSDTGGRWGSYAGAGLLGSGGMGEVHRVRDASLGRTVALKVARGGLSDERIARFVQEARVTAQLQHPGIVAVHELGRLPDGRHYFTMKEIRGREFGVVIAEAHARSPGAGTGAGTSAGAGAESTEWSLRRLVGAFHDACEAVAYAHSRGVVHRDLKPANIMVGDFGEVIVVDWGLAKILGQPHLGQPEADPGFDALEPVVGDLSLDATRQGTVQGTPAYMSPEQAIGEVDKLGPAADVYALGAVLFQLLSGRPPFVASGAMAVLRRVIRGQREPLVSGWMVPPALRAIVDRAMQLEPADRFADAGELAAEVAAWLEGARRRAEALQAVEAADSVLPELARLDAEAKRLHREAAELLTDVPPHAPVDDKLPGWRKEDAAREAERQLLLQRQIRVQHLHSALRIDPELAEAGRRLGAHYRRQHEEAELQGDGDAAIRAEVNLRAYDDGRHAVYLRADGKLSLKTSPAGAMATAYRYVQQDRRLVPQRLGELGLTPLDAVDLAAGSYMILVEGQGFSTLRYPVRIPRGGHWDGVPPDAEETEAVPLLRPGELGPEDCYLPAGWTWVGGDPEAPDSLPLSQIWIPGVVLRQHPVRVREYRAFLEDLLLQGRREEALARRPRHSTDEAGARTNFVVVGEQVELAPDDDGVTWEPDWPVVLVSWEDAMAFAGWEAERTGQPWRLLHDLEWEKAARGVDGRHFPWGDHFEPTWARTLNSQEGPPGLCAVGQHPVDEGPCGARDLAGLVRDWCLNDYERADAFDPAEAIAATPGRGGFRYTRGGAFASGPGLSRNATRLAGAPTGRWTMVGFRLGRSLT